MCENYRVRRGMVFWFDFDPDVDKYSVPPINVGGRTYPDRLMYGERPYLVVSSNKMNECGQIAQIVPIHSYPKNKSNPLWVYTEINCKEAAIRCDQIRSVNLIELQDYRMMLPDSVMEEVDKTLMKVLGFDNVIESIKKALIKSYGIDDKATNIFNSAFNAKEVELNRGESKLAYSPIQQSYIEFPDISNLSDRLSALEKNANGIADSNKQESSKDEVENEEVKAVRKKGSRRSWTDEEILEFLNDDESHDSDYMVKKYGCKDVKSLYTLRWRLKKRFEG